MVELKCYLFLKRKIFYEMHSFQTIRASLEIEWLNKQSIVINV
jgi:hypothetical protein